MATPEKGGCDQAALEGETPPEGLLRLGTDESDCLVGKAVLSRYVGNLRYHEFVSEEADAPCIDLSVPYVSQRELEQFAKWVTTYRDGEEEIPGSGVTATKSYNALVKAAKTSEEPGSPQLVYNDDGEVLGLHREVLFDIVVQNAQPSIEGKPLIKRIGGGAFDLLNDYFNHALPGMPLLPVTREATGRQEEARRLRERAPEELLLTRLEGKERLWVTTQSVERHFRSRLANAHVNPPRASGLYLALREIANALSDGIDSTRKYNHNDKDAIEPHSFVAYVMSCHEAVERGDDINLDIERQLKNVLLPYANELFDYLESVER